MNTTELIAQYRLHGDDNTAPYFLSDTQVAALYNEAIEEACTRRDLIFDMTTEAVCEISVIAATASYATHAAIVNIQAAYLVDTDEAIIYLDMLTRDGLDRTRPAWREEEADEPELLVYDETSVQLVPTPSASYTLYLEVNRIPLAAEKLGAGTAPNVIVTPAISSIHHRKLHHWVVGSALNMPDADRFAPGRAEAHLAQFNRYFGQPQDADLTRDTRENRPHRNTLY